MSMKISLKYLVVFTIYGDLHSNTPAAQIVLDAAPIVQNEGNTAVNNWASRVTTRITRLVRPCVHSDEHRLLSLTGVDPVQAPVR